MTDTCEECGREFAKSSEEWFESHDLHGYPNSTLCGAAVDLGPSECRIHTIKRLKARVAQLEGELENYNTNTQDSDMRAVVIGLNCILDERRQADRFKDPGLQALAERILRLSEHVRLMRFQQNG